MNAYANILKVSNLTQKVLFEHEIKGQISDGMWENTKPMNHWQAWCRAEVVVDAEHPGRNFWAQKDNYGLTRLIEYVGDRMIFTVKLSKVMAPEAWEALEGYSLPDNKAQLAWYQERAAKDDWYAETCKRWADAGLTAELLDKAEAVKYTEKDLRKDLAALSKVMKTFSA